MTATSLYGGAKHSTNTLVVAGRLICTERSWSRNPPWELSTCTGQVAVPWGTKNLAVGWQLLARARIERNRKRLEVVDVRLKSARGGGAGGGARAGARAGVGHVSPQQGDLVQLTLVPQLTSGHDDAPTVAARVEGGCQKPHSAVARLVLKVG